MATYAQEEWLPIGVRRIVYGGRREQNSAYRPADFFLAFKAVCSCGAGRPMLIYPLLCAYRRFGAGIKGE